MLAGKTISNSLPFEKFLDLEEETLSEQKEVDAILDNIKLYISDSE